MGCTQSKIENEDSVIRCKNRKLYMGQAVASRNAFAAAQAAYAVALKNTGAALSEFGQGELQDLAPSLPSSAGAPSSSSTAAVASVIKPPMETLPPPPPPPPSDASVASPLQRSASMPADLAIPKSNKKHPSKIPADAAIREEDEGERADDELSPAGNFSPAPAPAPPPQPQPQPQPQQARPVSPPRSAPVSETWDYFFGSGEHMMPPDLSQPEETIWTETREVEREESIKVKTTVLPAARTDKVHRVETVPTPAKVVNELPPTQLKQVKKIKNSVPMDHQHVSSAGASEIRKSKTVAANVNLIQNSVPMDHQHVSSAGASEIRKSKTAAANVNLIPIFIELDDHFLRASESAQEVSKMLEAPRMHYHSNFADNRGHIDHSVILMRVITWNRSFKAIPQAEIGKDNFENDESETHATILDKMLAWEKKLFDEVKAGELMKIEYQKKVAMLNKQKKHGVNLAALEKTKSAVSHLHMRYIVDIESMDSTVSEINRLRDHQLYPKLGELVNGMARMWETMYLHHSNQFKLTKDLRAIEIQLAPRETSQQHHNRTVQLLKMVGDWDSQFRELLNHQKEYIKSLNSWLNLNLVPVEHSGKETSSPHLQHEPPSIQALLNEWLDQLENLPVNLAKSALSTFSGAIHALVLFQVEELNSKLKWDDARKDYERKIHEFEEWHRKYMEKTEASTNEVDAERSEGIYQQDHVSERKITVENAEIKLKAAEDSYKKQCKLVRDKSLASLRTHLPELFRAMRDFSYSCSEVYKKLSSISKSHIPVNN